MIHPGETIALSGRIICAVATENSHSPTSLLKLDEIVDMLLTVNEIDVG